MKNKKEKILIGFILREKRLPEGFREEVLFNEKHKTIAKYLLQLKFEVTDYFETEVEYIYLVECINASYEILGTLEGVWDSVLTDYKKQRLLIIADMIRDSMSGNPIDMEIIKEVIDDYDKKPVDSVAIKHIAEIAEYQRGLMSIEKIPTGIDFLDTVFDGGLSKGNSVVVAAVAGHGKTAFMQTMSYHFARQNQTCLWFTYEENAAEIWSRFERMGMNKDSQLFAPIDYEDNKIDFIEKVIRKMKKTNDFFVVFIDQLSNIAPKVSGNTELRQLSSNFSLYLGRMSEQLKTIAMKYQIIIIVAHQLGRTGELAYSDMIRHAPDKVLYLKREENETKMQPYAEQFTGKTFLKVNKNRPIGTTPTIPMKVVDGKFVHFGEIEINGSIFD